MAQSIERLKAQARIAAQYLDYRQRHLREFIDQDHWYDWQLESFRAGAECDEVMTLAGNQSGKTLSATFEQGLHITCDYPEWWEGDTLPGAGVHWIFGVDSTQLRDVVQTQLIGSFNTDSVHKFEGGGWIHPDEIINWVPHPNKKGLLADVYVKNKRGGTSVVSLRTYTQTETGRGTLSFAGSKVDSIYVDEQPPDSLIGQLAARRAMGRQGKGGIIRYTMTPELGLTELVRIFMEDPGEHQRLIGPIGWNQCPHMTPEKQKKLLGSIPPHEHEMRSLGVPFFGSGMVYPVGEQSITCDPFEIPYYFRRLAGLDIGTTHATAIAWCAYDPDQDVIYIYAEHKEKEPSVAVHVAAFNAKEGGRMPLVFPHDIDKTTGHAGERGAGKTYRMMYEDGGVSYGIDFKNPDGTRFVEPGVTDMLERMKTGRFKVFSTCSGWFKEFRKYHRDKGQIVKKDDDLMDCSRYGSQMVADHGVTAERQRPTRVIATRR